VRLNPDFILTPTREMQILSRYVIRVRKKRKISTR